VVQFVLVIDEKYDGFTNHQVVAALCGRLGVFGLLGVMAQVLSCTSAFLQWMLSICFQKNKKRFMINNLCMIVVQDPHP
jgi:hypothetical protein